MINSSNLNNNIRFTSGKYDSVRRSLTVASDSLQAVSKDSIELGETKKSKFYEKVGGLFQKVLNSKRYDEYIKSTLDDKKEKKGVESEKFQKLLIYGNTGKETIRCLFYTGLTLTNPDMPYDKRLFVSLFHIGIGIVSISLQLILGLGAIKYQNKIIDGMLNKFKLEKTVHDRTKSGLKFFIPLVLTSIIAKRFIAPAFATPFAGIQKRKLTELENNKKSAAVPINNSDYHNEKISCAKTQ